MNGLYITVCSEYKNKKSYGIALTETADGSTNIIQTVADISPIQGEIDHLVKMCNELRLDPIHLGDVIEDFLA